MLNETDTQFATLDTVEVFDQKIGFTNAINITSDIMTASVDSSDINEIEDMLAALPATAAVNQAPVGTPEIFLLNSDSVRDGQYTTASAFFIATRWNNTDLCYDPDGGSLTLIHNTSFPAGYIAQVADSAGTYAGYMINISNRGTYPFVFAFVDSSGESTEITSLVFNIISRGVFESVDGELLDAAQVDEYQITVDFSVSDEYVLSAMRTGTGGFTIKAYDAAGTECGSLYTTDPSYVTIQKDSFTLEKPEGVTGAYTYTVKVTTDADSFVEGDTRYRFAYGQASQKFYFFEDVADAVELPRFTPARNYSQVRNAFVNRTKPSEYGDYYRITATGPETVTMAGAEGLYRFKVLDATTLEPLYDGASLTPYNPSEIYTNIISVTINFAAGESYYIVVYNPQCSDNHENYLISVGDRELLSNHIAISIPQTSFVAGVPQIFTFSVNTPNGLPGYIDHVRLSTTMVGFHLSDSMYSVMTPGTNTWVNNMRHSTGIDFGFGDNQTLVGYNGEWQLRMIPTETGTFPASTFYIYYEFQI